MRWVALVTGFLLGFVVAQANFPKPEGQVAIQVNADGKVSAKGLR
jgi:hypothetical protein